MAFIRQQMLGMRGDPLRFAGIGKKGRVAGGGTKSKAARHRIVRFNRMAGDPAGFQNPFSPAAMKMMSTNKAVQGAMGVKPGAFDSFLSGLGKAANFAIPFLPGGAIAKTAMNLGAGALASLQRKGAAPTFGAMPGMPAGLGFLPGFEGGGGGSSTNKDGSPRRIRADGKPYKRPSLNALNPKALARAGRRFTGFKKAIRAVNASLPGGMKFEAPAARTHTKRKR